jgi:hypothetical protein
MKQIFTALIFLSNTFSSKAQSSEIGSWNILSIKHKFNNKFGLLAEGQIRSLKFYNNFHYYEYKAAIDYNPTKTLQLTLGIGDYNTFSEGGNFKTPIKSDEIRLWPQIQLSQTIGIFKIEQRYRWEMRFTNNEYNNRFRYRVGVQLPFGFTKSQANKSFKIAVYNEIFFTDKEPYFVRNRFSTQLTAKLNKSLSLMLGYLHQFDYKINDETGKDFIMLGYYIDL